MGEIERAAQKRKRLGQVQKALLMTAVVSGLLLIGGAPRITIGNRNCYRFKNQAKTALIRLAQKGYVTFVREKKGMYAQVTPLGKRLLAVEEQKMALELNKKKRWDKKWRVVIFDIPEYRRSARDQLRIVMRSAGFYRLQDSVWLYPYDCEDFMALLKADLKIGSEVLYMIVDHIENDGKLKEHYSLK